MYFEIIGIEIMITIKNVKDKSGSITDVFVRSPDTHILDAKAQLLSLPAFVDANTDFTIPLEAPSGDWEAWAKALLQSGITAVFLKDISPEIAKSQKEQVESRLKTVKMPLKVYFFVDGTNPSNFDEIGKSKAFFKGIKTSIDLANVPLKPYNNALERIFQIAAQEDLPIIIDLLQSNKGITEQRKAALAALKLAIELTEKYGAQLCVQYVRTQDEIALIQAARERNLLVFAEVGCPHLFINEANSSEMALTSSAHFLPTPVDQNVLWKALNNGIIDMIDSGSRIFSNQHLTLATRLWLPLLLTAYQENKLSLETLIAVSRVNAENIFRLSPNEDTVLVDTSTIQPPTIQLAAQSLKKLIGWPAYLIIQGELITVSQTLAAHP